MIPFFILAIENNEDQAYLEELYQKDYGLIKKAVLGIVGQQGRPIADDLVHDTYIKLIRYIETLKKLDPPALTVYLQCVARSVTINYLKKEKMRSKEICAIPPGQLEQIIYNFDNSVPSMENQSDLSITMNSYLYKLPHRDRDILVLKYYFCLKDKEVANIVGVKKSNIREYAMRAREKLRKLVQDEELL